MGNGELHYSIHTDVHVTDVHVIIIQFIYIMITIRKLCLVTSLLLWVLYFCMNGSRVWEHDFARAGLITIIMFMKAY